MNGITNFHGAIWSDIENRLAPLPEGSKEWKIFQIIPLLAELPVGIAVSLLQAVNKIIAYIASFSPWPRLPDPEKDFSSVLLDSRQWNKLGNIEEKITLGHNNPNFLFGTATCTYQDSGSFHCPDSQWAKWEEKKVPEGNRSGKSADLFALYKTKNGRKQITDSLHQLGVNSYRFSIDWSQIELQQGCWNESNLQVYVDLCKHLCDEGSN